MKHVSYGRAGSGEEGGAGGRRKPRNPRPQGGPRGHGGPYVSRAATGGVMREQVRGQARAGVTGVRRLGGEARGQVSQAQEGRR